MRTFTFTNTQTYTTTFTEGQINFFANQMDFNTPVKNFSTYGDYASTVIGLWIAQNPTWKSIMEDKNYGYVSVNKVTAITENTK